MEGTQVSIGLVFLAGMVSFLSPCVLPIIPAYLTLISGVSFEQLQESESVRQARGRLFTSALAFVGGFGIVTILMLGGIATVMHTLGPVWQDRFRWAGGILVLIFALHMIGLFRLNFLYNERRFHLNDNKFGLLGAVLIGAAFGFGWSPCIGPILGGVLAMAASASSPFAIWSLLIAYVLGLAVPFLLAAVFVNLFLTSMRKFSRHLRKVEIAAGVLLLVMGVLLLTKNLAVLSQVGGPLAGISQKMEGFLK